LIAGLSFAGSAQALTFNFSFGGDGNVTSSGTITVGPDSHADTSGIFGTPANQNSLGGPPPNFQGIVDPSNALAVTGISGIFSDAALGIADATITGLVMTNPQPHYDNDYTIPFSFGWYPGIPATVVSYDNLFYAGGAAPITCLGVPPAVSSMITASCSRVPTAPSWISTAMAAIHPASTARWSGRLEDPSPDYTSAGGLTLAVPEPSTWAMMVLGFGGLGFAGYRASRKAAAIAA